MTEDFFFFKCHMETPLDWFFYTKKKSHFHLLLGQTRAQKKSSSELDTRYLIPKCFSPYFFFTHSKTAIGLRVIQSSSGDFFDLVIVHLKVASNWLNIWAAKLKPILENNMNDLWVLYLGQNSYGRTTILSSFSRAFFDGSNVDNEIILLSFEFSILRELQRNLD